jgi:hypothetical protein
LPHDVLKIVMRGKEKEDRGMIDVNIKGVMYGIAAALPHMQRQKARHFINVSSVDDPHRRPGVHRRQERGLDGEGERRPVSEVMRGRSRAGSELAEGAAHGNRIRHRQHDFDASSSCFLHFPGTFGHSA